MNDKEANCRADLDAALAALKESNRLLIRSIATRDIRAVERQTIKLRASRWRLADAVRQFEKIVTN